MAFIKTEVRLTNLTDRDNFQWRQEVKITPIWFFNNGLQTQTNPSDVQHNNTAKLYMYMRVCVFVFSNSRGKRKVSVVRKRVFSPLSFSDYCCFGSWRPVMETWLSGKFVAVCCSAALHSNQQLSTQPRLLLMMVTNCLTNSQHYLRASVK